MDVLTRLLLRLTGAEMGLWETLARCLLRCSLTFIRIQDTCTGKVREVSRDGDLPILRVQASIFIRLPVTPETFEVSSLFGRDWLGDPLVVPPE